MWYDNINQINFFPGEIIYIAHPILMEYDIDKVKLIEVTFDCSGLKSFVYQYVKGSGVHTWDRNFNHYYDEIAFFKNMDEAINWCKERGKAFTIYD